jgi:PTH1 family peptidyl-tRNA hydrolase
MPSPALLIGLGNPGEEYNSTYHNVGWEALRFFEAKLNERYGAADLQKGKNFHFKKYGTEIGDRYLVYPATFMNNSGEAVKAALEWFGVRPEDTVVFHDDSDLAIGERKEASGGAAGHHGVESILKFLGDAPLLRVRIGIRDPREKTGEEPRRKAGEFVLKRIRPEDARKLEEVFGKLAETFLA